jgi:hypothetical protein
MPLNPVEMLHDHCADFPAPRQRRCDDHPLIHMLCLSLCAVLCGVEPCTEMEAFGQAKAAWLSPYLDLSRGLASHDTVNRVLRLLEWIGRINGLFVPHPASLPAPHAGGPAVPTARAAA